MKNKMMRIASVLMVAALLSTCVISGTFAKYIKTASAGDTARVAKFGVVIEAEGELFATEYDLEEELLTDASFELSVESSDDDKLVAPGTSGEAGGITITGTPEVAVRIGVAADVTLEGWMIPAPAQEEVPGQKAASEVFYCPLVITVGTEELSGLDYDSAEDFAAAIKEAVEGEVKEFAPNTDLSDEELAISVAWEWAFEGDDASDTALGDAAAEGNASTIAIDIAVTVTQID